MVRRDAIDLGVWTRVSPSRLIVPLDTHVIRLARCLRLTRYTSPGWKMAADITALLERLNTAGSTSLVVPGEAISRIPAGAGPSSPRPSVTARRW